MSVRIAAIADLHYGRSTVGPKLPAVLQAASEAANVLVICGDLTDYGRAEEADGLAGGVGARLVPLEEQRARGEIDAQTGVVLLDPLAQGRAAQEVELDPLDAGAGDG